MVEFDAFRRGLAEVLAGCAEARAGGREATARDREAATLLHRLADDAVNLDLHVFLLCRLLLTHEDLTDRLRDRCGPLLAQVGVTVWPGNVTALVRWMLGEVMRDRHVPLKIVPAPGPATASRPRACRGGGRPTRSKAGSPSSATLSALSDFSAGLGLVAPIVALHEAMEGVRQWRERAFAAAHPATTATVVATTPEAGVRGRASPTAATVSFSPYPGSPPCLATVALGAAADPVGPGGAVAVVPRSAACGIPLVVSQIGDPAATFVLAAALMTGGVAALALWNRMWRRHHRTSLARTWSGALGPRLPRTG